MADKTALQESSQALFCAIADLIDSGKIDKVLNKDTYPNFKAFREFWDKEYKSNSIDTIFRKHVETPSVSLDDIEKFLEENNDWYISSVLIAKKLIEDIASIVKNYRNIKKPSASEVWYVRGDKPVMKNIEALFKIANEGQKKLNSIEGAKKSVTFGDINKWSPADIYFASDKARDKIEKTLNISRKNDAFTFTDLNSLISSLIDEGQLLPLSLKKQTKSVVLLKVNFDRKYELNTISKYKYYGTSDWKVYKDTSPQTRDLKVFFTQDKKDHIKIRHDASSMAFKAEYIGASSEARGGSIGSDNIFGDLLNTVDSTFGQKFVRIYKQANKDYKDQLKTLGTKPDKNKDKKGYEAWDVKRGRLSALCVTNKIIPPLLTWLNSNQARSDQFVSIIYQYITSRTADSSKFVIAK